MTINFWHRRNGPTFTTGSIGARSYDVVPRAALTCGMGQIGADAIGQSDLFDRLIFGQAFEEYIGKEEVRLKIKKIIAQADEHSSVVDTLKTINLTGDTPIDAMLRRCMETLRVKGNDYTIGAGSNDRLFNFREGGKHLGLSMEEVWGVFWWKHVTAVLRYCKEGQVESEPILDRVMDCIVYLLLMTKMIDEKNNVKEKKVE